MEKFRVSLVTPSLPSLLRGSSFCQLAFCIASFINPFFINQNELLPLILLDTNLRILSVAKVTCADIRSHRHYCCAYMSKCDLLSFTTNCMHFFLLGFICLSILSLAGICTVLFFLHSRGQTDAIEQPTKHMEAPSSDLENKLNLSLYL